MFDANKVLCIVSGFIACSLVPKLLQRHQSYYNLKIIKKYFQPKIGRKMRILQPGPEKQYSYQKRKKDIYHGRRFVVVIKHRVMSWFTQPY